MALVKQHTPGDIRYFTYYLHFPHDNDVWVDQVPFVHDLLFEISRCGFVKRDPHRGMELLNKGETHWTDHNGVTHRVVIETEKRQRRWGKPQDQLKLMRG